MEVDAPTFSTVDTSSFGRLFFCLGLLRSRHLDEVFLCGLSYSQVLDEIAAGWGLWRLQYIGGGRS